MFPRLAALAAFVLPLASALTLDTPVNATTGGMVTITWQATTTDPGVFSLEMVNTVFHNTFAIANNVQTSTGSLTLELPQVPVGGGYTIEAIQNNDINVIYATSGSFTVGAQVTSTTTTSSASTSTGTGTTSAGTSIAAASSITTPASIATSSSSATPSASNINSGSVPFKLNWGPVGVVILSALAGVVVLF